MSYTIYANSTFQATLIRQALDAQIDYFDPRDFKVSAFCQKLNISRSSFYKLIAPKLPEINRIRTFEVRLPIPLPRTFDHRRFLRNQEDQFHDLPFCVSSHFSRSPGRPPKNKAPISYQDILGASQ